MDKKIIIPIILILFMVAVSGCISSDNSKTSNNYTVGTSSFQLTGAWTEGFNSNGSSASKIRLDSSNQTIIVTQYNNTPLYKKESENANLNKNINGTTVYYSSSTPYSIWFKKSGIYYNIFVQNMDSNGNWVDADSSALKYITEIINTITNNNPSIITNSSETNSNQTVKAEASIISASKACKIVTKSFSGYDCYGSSAKLITSKGKKVYKVNLKNRADDSNAGYVIVDAQTGNILSK